MSKSVRIRTKPGEDGYIKLNVDLEQNFDLLEILSLKLSQVEDYQNFCADYGIIAGRVIINNGFGVPNVKVSIFIPIEDIDVDNGVISSIYPYTAPTPDQKNVNGVRYNVLPNTQQSLDHTPVGSFPEKREILDNDTTLEIYEKYYKFTTTTNKAGDYALFGVPVGDHTLHYDMDISDIGFLSARPYELIAQGYSEDLFEDRFTFKTSNNLDSLAQIFSENLPVTIEPYWCDSLSVGSIIGINRKDIYINNIELTPQAIFFGSIFSDDEKDSLNKNCNPDRDMGKMNEVITNAGKLEAIRRNIEGGIETFKLPGDTIDENGNWSVQLPMNMRKVVTDEFGNLVPSPDGKKGVATEGDYRFRVSMEATDNDKRLRERAKFLVPNLTGNYVFRDFSYDELKNSEDFRINDQLSTITTNTPYSADTTNQYNYLEDFFTFRWKKVYTVKQYIGRYQKLQTDQARSFVGIKDIYNGVGVNKFPTNRADTMVHPLYTVICVLVSFFAHLVALVNGIINVFNGLITGICQAKFPVGLKIYLKYCFRIGTGVCNDNYRYGPDGFGSPTSTQYWSTCGETQGKCNNCKNNSSCNKDGEFHLSIKIKWKCLFGKWFCKRCKDYCGTTHGCCLPNHDSGCSTNDYCLSDDCSSFAGCGGDTGACGGSGQCCQACCVKIPLIQLACQEEGIFIQPSIIKSPFADPECNATYVTPFCCLTCGGLQTPVIKGYVACVMEPIAAWLKMLKFDFYNDWVSGSLYFPLIKRKKKVKKSRRKSGQIKKDKFCDFDCIIRKYPETVAEGALFLLEPPIGLPFKDTPLLQGPLFYWTNRIRIIKPGWPFNLAQFFIPTKVTVNGCTAKIRGNITTQWYGSVDSTEQINLNNAANEINLAGKNSEGNGCRVTFANFNEVVNILDNQYGFEVNGTPNRKWKKRTATEHGKPEYVKSNDPISGVDSWKNLGGHGHHKNICNRTRLVERSEYFKSTLDCAATTPSGTNFQAPIEVSEPEMEDPSGGATIGTTSCLDDCYKSGNLCPTACCKSTCSTNGVAACNKFCPCDSIPGVSAYKGIIRHGYATMGDLDGFLYYTALMKPARPKYGQLEDPFFNTAQYKANLIMPVTISELGSSTYCDIDDAPFVMDKLSPTTFQVSYETLKYKLDPINETGGEYQVVVNSIEDKDSSLNVRAYADFSCVATVCLNTMATVNQSQLGVDIIDTNDIGIEIGNCFMRFEHDDDTREYFCKRFSGYKNGSLDVHYMRPGSTEFDNTYQTYPEMTLTEGVNLTYSIDGERILSEYNDSEPFFPGDACGFKLDQSIYSDYFYGLAPGMTSGLIDFPNNPPNSTIGFVPNSSFNTDDVINQITYNDQGHPDLEADDINGNLGVKAIKFSTSQTPFYFYFGLLAGKTSLHKTVGKFFADKINAETLQGIGDDGKASENKHNQTNINTKVKSPYNIFRTCLGDTEIPTGTSGGYIPSGTPPGTNNSNCSNFTATGTATSPSATGAADGTASCNPQNGTGTITYMWSNGQTTQTATGLLEGSYTCIASDFYGCTAQVTIEVGAGALQPYEECYSYGIYWKCWNCPSSVTEAQYTYTDCNGVQQTKTFYKNCPEALSGGFQICSSTPPENFPLAYVGYENLHFSQLTFPPNDPNCNDGDTEISTPPVIPPNYTMLPLTYNPAYAQPSSAFFQYVPTIASNELIYADGTSTIPYWGNITESGGNYQADTSGSLGKHALGNIVVDFSQTAGPAVVSLYAFAGTKLDSSDPIWNTISYSQYNPFIWVTFGIRKVNVLGSGGQQASTYDNSPAGTHAVMGGSNWSFYGTCEEEGVVIPNLNSQCCEFTRDSGQVKGNPFGPGLNIVSHGTSPDGNPHKPWLVWHHQEDRSMDITLWEEGTYEYIIYVNGYRIGDLTENDGYVIIE